MKRLFTKAGKTSKTFISKKEFEKGNIPIPNLSSKTFKLPPPEDEIATLKGQAILYLQQNKLKDAKYIFPRIADKTPEGYSSFLKIFKFYETLNSEVMKYNRETDILPELLENFQTDDDFHTIPLLFHLSQDFIQQGQFAKSITILGYALDIAAKKIQKDPMNSEMKNLVFYTYEQIGHNYLSLYEFEEAEKIFEKALSLKQDEKEDIDITTFLSYLSFCQFHLGKFDECKATAEKCLQIISRELKKLAPEEEERILIESIYKSVNTLMNLEELKNDFESALKLHNDIIAYAKENQVKEVEIFYKLGISQLCYVHGKLDEAIENMKSINFEDVKDLRSEIRDDRKGLYYELWCEIYTKKNDRKMMIESKENYHEFLRETFLYKNERFDISGFEADLMDWYKEENDIDSMNDLYYIAVGNKIHITKVLSQYYLDKKQYKEAIPSLKTLIKSLETNDNMDGKIYRQAIKDLLICFDKIGNTTEKTLYEEKLKNMGCNIL